MSAQVFHVNACLLRHPPSGSQLLHVGVDEGNPRLEGSPPDESIVLVVEAPWLDPLAGLLVTRLFVEFSLNSIDRIQARAVLEGNQPEVVSPEELKDDPVATAVAALGAIALVQLGGSMRNRSG